MESLGPRLDNMPSKSEGHCENFFSQKIEDPIPANKEEVTRSEISHTLEGNGQITFDDVTTH